MTSQTIDELTTGELSRGRERRLSRRLICNGFAETFAYEAGFLFRGEIRDISQTGCYIMTKARLKLKRLSEVEVIFKLKEREFRVLARVMDIRPGQGVGLQFLFHDLLEEDSIRKVLRTLVEESSPMPAPKPVSPLTLASSANSPSARAEKQETAGPVEGPVGRTIDVPKVSNMPSRNGSATMTG